MGTKFSEVHNRAMARHSQLFDTYITITYAVSGKNKAFKIKCTINSLKDEEKARGAYSSSTVDITLRYDDIKNSEEVATKVKDCILSGYKGRNIKFEGITYSVLEENPNGSTRDCVVLRCSIPNGSI